MHRVPWLIDIIIMYLHTNKLSSKEILYNYRIYKERKDSLFHHLIVHHNHHHRLLYLTEDLLKTCKSELFWLLKKSKINFLGKRITAMKSQPSTYRH